MAPTKDGENQSDSPDDEPIPEDASSEPIIEEVNNILFFRSFAWLKAPGVFKLSLDIIVYFLIILILPPALTTFSNACFEA